jgi:enediyne biosynthesis protein E4
MTCRMSLCANRTIHVRFLVIACCSVLAGVLVSNALAQPPTDCLIRLSDMTASSGIVFEHTDGGSGEQYIVEFVVAGLALFDYDADGLIDIYFLNGAPLRGASTETIPRNALYRNNGDWSFTDVTEAAGVGDPGYGLGVVVGDYDNDGDEDIYLNNYGPNVLYRNSGDGTFTDVAEQAGVANGDKVGAGACFLDMDGDGDLDLYAANYVDFTYENHKTTMLGYLKYSDPKDYHPVPDTLFRNNGDGTFTDVSHDSGIDLVADTGMGTVCFDYDDDRDSDIFVCNDVNANFLFRNDGKGQFTELGLVSGVAFNFEGSENASMGADCGDYDNDGRLDLFMTDYSDESPVLYRNLGDGFFEDATAVAHAGSSAYPHTNWGTGLIDFDNDGDRDLFVANGHGMADYHKIDDRTAYRVQNILMMNLGNGRFLDVTEYCGNGLAPVESSKGVAFDDLDNDGDVDVVILNANSKPTILRNDSKSKHHWVQIALRGIKSNRGGVGARVRVIAGDLVQTAEVHSGRSYQSHFGTRLHFGLEQNEQIDRIEVRWLGGGTDVLSEIEPDRLIVITEKDEVTAK